MRVIFSKISESDPEYAVLHTNRRDASIERLQHYIENDSYAAALVSGIKDGSTWRIYSTNILFIESQNEIQYIHTRDGVFESRERLYAFMEKLPRWFVRCSKSAVLNLRQVHRYTPLSGGLMQAEFRNNEKVFISRKYVREIREQLKEEL